MCDYISEQMASKFALKIDFFDSGAIIVLIMLYNSQSK